MSNKARNFLRESFFGHECLIRFSTHRAGKFLYRHQYLAVLASFVGASQFGRVLLINTLESQALDDGN
jgi:hypothetical protein